MFSYITCGAQSLGILSNQLHYRWSKCFTFTLHPHESLQFIRCIGWKTNLLWNLCSVTLQVRLRLMLPFWIHRCRRILNCWFGSGTTFLQFWMGIALCFGRCVYPGNLETWKQITNLLLWQLIFWGRLCFIRCGALCFSPPLLISNSFCYSLCM